MREKRVLLAYQELQQNKERYNVGSWREDKQGWLLLILPFLIDQNFINRNMWQFSSVLDKKENCNSVSDLINNVRDQCRDKLRMLQFCFRASVYSLFVFWFPLRHHTEKQFLVEFSFSDLPVVE